MSEFVAEFLAMGGYALYVWPAYACFALVLGGLAVHGFYRGRAVRAELADIEARRAGRRS